MAWLESLRPWGRRLVGRLGLRDHEGEDAVQEAFERATIYNLLRLARQDFAAAMARDAVADRGPVPRRGRRRP